MKTTTPGILEWLIIGGGVHGTHLSHVLAHGAEVDRDRVRVIDPHREPLARWRQCTANTGMKYLRSPVVHHIDLDPMSLLNFARNEAKGGLGGFRPPYDRPALALFEAHCDHVCERWGLHGLRHQAAARDLRSTGNGFVVDTDQGELKARRVVLALGNPAGPKWPLWAAGLRSQGARVAHLFDDHFHIDACRDWRKVAVIGLGISGAQVAAQLVQEFDADVSVVSRHDIKIEQFDSDPCWLGPRCQVGFQRLSNYRERREAIDGARHRGSMPRDVARDFERYLDWGQIAWHRGAVEAAGVGDDQRLRLVLNTEEVLDVDGVILATGFSKPRVDETWLSGATRRLGLRCSSCGMPIVDSSLQWKEGLFVGGGMAELELGPASRNIAGARMTARRLAGAF